MNRHIATILVEGVRVVQEPTAAVDIESVVEIKPALKLLQE